MEKGVATINDLLLDIQETERLGVRTIYRLDIHIHNDFLLGSRELMVHTSGFRYTTATSNLLHERLYIFAMFTSGTDAWI